ncbi:MAG TPA: hypothetical protein VMC43_02385 [Candidatus Paceibacterota bacterium]|nr:hypothetical protein [Candidatus Paceibacterota bacterium]
MADVSTFLTKLEERRRKKRRFIRRTVLLAIIVGLVGGIFWVIFRAPFLRIRDIQVIGNARTSTDDIVHLTEASVLRSSLIGRLLGYDNILAWPNVLPGDILKNAPSLRSIAITRDYRARSITISVVERKPVAVWCLMKNNPVNCVWFDDAGVAFESAPEFEGSLVPVVHDYASDGISLGSPVLPARDFSNLLSVLTAFRQTTVSVKEIRYENPALEELRLTTFDGPMIYVSLRFPADNIPTTLEALKAQSAQGALTPAFRNLQYVDFRVQNRAYYQ